MVGERRGWDEGTAVSSAGLSTSEDAGMSSEKCVRTTFAVSLRFPTQGQSASGESSLSRGRKA
jgi:hypothetical protein